jgi:hypothetical protein
MSYMVNNAPQGMSTNDMWAHADAALARAYILRGDMQGAMHAREYVFQMQHAGAVQNLMHAYRALAVNDTAGAAQLLAKSVAFVQDGSTVAFKAGPNGSLWGQRFVDATQRPVGTPFQVTPQGIAQMLNQTMDPQQFLKTRNEEQKTMARVAHNQNMELIRLHGIDTTAGTAAAGQASREGIAAAGQEAATGRTEMQQAGADARVQAQIDAANQRATDANQRYRDVAAAKAGQIANARLAAITKETNETYDPTLPEFEHMAPQDLARSKDLYAALRTYAPNIQGGSAKTYASNLLNGTFSLRPMSDGRDAVLDNTNKPIAYIPHTALQHLATPPGGAAAPAQPQAAPIPPAQQQQQQPMPASAQ